MDREMGIEDPEYWEEENPYDYMPYQVNYPKGSAKEIEAALRIRGLRLRKDVNQSLTQNPTAWKCSEQASTIAFCFANACGNATRHSSK
jgi:hypothetical protein